MNGALLSTQIQAALAPWNGTQLQLFSSALGNGICTSLIGKLQFKTQDIGTVPGFGTGNGLGIKGLVPPLMAQIMFAKGQAAWAAKQNNGPGVEWMIFCTKVSTAVATHLATLAITKSTHPAVFAGIGKITEYKGVTADDMSSAIVAAAPGSWAKARFPELALAVATGVMTNVLGHTPVDVQAIAGAPAGIPVPGGGNGNGVVT